MLPPVMIALLTKLGTCELNVDDMIADPPIHIPSQRPGITSWNNTNVEKLIIEAMELIHEHVVPLTSLLYLTYSSIEAYEWAKMPMTNIDPDLAVHIRTIVCQLVRNVLDSGKYVFPVALDEGDGAVAVLPLFFYDGTSCMPGDWVEIR